MSLLTRLKERLFAKFTLGDKVIVTMSGGGKKLSTISGVSINMYGTKTYTVTFDCPENSMKLWERDGVRPRDCKGDG